MKKIILFLFLILGVVVFAGPEDLPSYVNKQKFEENGYQIRVNKVDTFTIVKRKEAENVNNKNQNNTMLLVLMAVAGGVFFMKQSKSQKE